MRASESVDAASAELLAGSSRLREADANVRRIMARYDAATAPRDTWSLLHREVGALAADMSATLERVAAALASVPHRSVFRYLAVAALQGAPVRASGSALVVNGVAVPDLVHDLASRVSLPMTALEVRRVHLLAVPASVRAALDAAGGDLDTDRCRAFSCSLGGVVLVDDAGVAAEVSGGSAAEPGVGAASAASRRGGHAGADTGAAAGGRAGGVAAGGTRAPGEAPQCVVTWAFDGSGVSVSAVYGTATALRRWRRDAMQSAHALVERGTGPLAGDRRRLETLRRHLVRLLLCGVCTVLACCTRDRDGTRDLAVLMPVVRTWKLLGERADSS